MRTLILATLLLVPAIAQAQSGNGGTAASHDAATLACVQSLGSAGSKAKCADLGGEWLQATGAVVATMPSLGYGKFDAGALVDQGGDPAFARTYEQLTVSTADPCTVEQFDLLQFPGKWAHGSESTFNFHKITRIRYLTKPEDFSNGATTAKDNPAVIGISMEGENWVCHKPISLDPAHGADAPACENDFAANAVGPENKSALLHALDIIRAACGLPK